MPQSVHTLIETRRDQMFPVLEPAEIDRLWRFGEPKFYAPGERMAGTGEIAPGGFVILAGRVDVSQRGRQGHSELIVTHGPGSFMGELAQLSDRPSLVDADAMEAVEAFVISPPRLRDLMVEEAELGERIMRALILRRVGLLDTGAGGPIIVGSADNRDVLRLEGFLTRSGHPHQRFDPKADPCAQTLIERFHIGSRELPIVLCPDGRLLRNPSDVELARCIGLVRPIDPDKIYDAVKDLHRPLTQSDDLDEILAWREERTVTRNLTLHYDRMVLLLDPTPLVRGLVRKKVEVVNYPDGRFAVQFKGTARGFRVFDKIQTVQAGAIVDNKRLSAVLEQVKTQQAAYQAHQRRGHVVRRPPPNNLEMRLELR